MNIFTPFYIVSAALSHESARSNVDRTDSLERWLRKEGYATVQVNGCYKGETEPAVLVVDDRPGNGLCAMAVLRLARQYGQESILAVDANRLAGLIYCASGGFKSIGHWRGAPEEIAKSRDAYTERAGQYYIVS